MPDYRRYYLSGQPVFITSVTHDRRRIFSDLANRDLLRKVTVEVQKAIPFELLAYVLLPDHFHWLILMPENRTNFSTPLQKIKWYFTLDYKRANHISSPVSIWQRGFWDHVIRNEEDLATHLDYIHWNPVKHGLVKRVEDWVDSSFQDWVDKDFYSTDWGNDGDVKGIIGLNFE
jgi:putative transposase